MTQLIPQTIEPGRTIGIGTARGYRPDVLERKFAIEAELLLKGYRGYELEEHALLLLRRKGLDLLHEEQARNTLVNGGTAIMLDALLGVVPVYYTNALAALGVGDSAAAFALTQTNLQGAVVTTNRIRKGMDATFPSRAANVATFRATFATTEANYIWNEWAIFNAVADGAGTMLNRAVANLGTKTSAASWQLTSTITQS
jgi:hypothetical protein